MEKQKYTCQYCFEEFKPTRRRVQKFCSANCRSKFHHAKKSQTAITIADSKITVAEKSPVLPKEKMSLAGVGNAAAGTLTADLVKNIFTSSDNKPATKGDLKLLTQRLQSRYHLVKNMAKRNDGALPYFDIATDFIIYKLPFEIKT